MSASMELCTRELVKVHLRKTSGEVDDLIDDMINVSSLEIEDYCGRRFMKASRSEVYDVDLDGTDFPDTLDLRDGPVDTSVTPQVFYWQNEAWAEQDISGLVTRVDSRSGLSSISWTNGKTFPVGIQTVKHTSTNGWATSAEDLPDLIQNIAARITVLHLNEVQHNIDIMPTVQVVQGNVVTFYNDARQRLLKRLDATYVARW